MVVCGDPTHQPSPPLSRCREHQRLHDDGHGVHVLQLLAKIDEIEIAQVDLIDRDDVMARDHFARQHATDGTPDIRVEHQRQRDARFDGVGHRPGDGLGERFHAVV